MYTLISLHIFASISGILNLFLKDEVLTEEDNFKFPSADNSSKTGFHQVTEIWHPRKKSTGAKSGEYGGATNVLTRQKNPRLFNAVWAGSRYHDEAPFLRATVQVVIVEISMTVWP